MPSVGVQECPGIIDPGDSIVDASGPKKLTPENWLEPEWVMSLFVQAGPDDPSPQPVSGDDWVKAITTPTLDESVPDEVRNLFETARGAFAYGYFFYPLYALGVEQAFRVAEAAVTHKCKLMGAPGKINTLYGRIEWLAGEGVIPEREKQIWEAIRKMRNMGSHLERQMLLPPGAAIGMLVRMAEKINALFALSNEETNIQPRVL